MQSLQAVIPCKHAVKIVSLDQNVISNLAKNGRDPFWRDLRERLISGVKAGKLLCPVPMETLAETAACSRDFRIRIRDLHQELSFGYFFKNYDKIEGEESLALVRPGLRLWPYERGRWKAVEDDGVNQALAKRIRDDQETMRRRMKVFSPPADLHKLTVKEIRAGVLAERCGSFYRQVERLLAGQPLNPADDLQIDLCRYLVSQRITKTELEQLLEKILTHAWEAIPLVTFAAALGALLDHGRIRGRKYDVNDEVDICRAAIALHSADMMITEKSMAYLAQQFEKEWGESLGVFAITEREQIMTALEPILTR